MPGAFSGQHAPSLEILASEPRLLWANPDAQSPKHMLHLWHLQAPSFHLCLPSCCFWPCFGLLQTPPWNPTLPFELSLSPLSKHRWADITSSVSTHLVKPLQPSSCCCQVYWNRTLCHCCSLLQTLSAPGYCLFSFFSFSVLQRSKQWPTWMLEIIYLSLSPDAGALCISLIDDHSASIRVSEGDGCLMT